MPELLSYLNQNKIYDYIVISGGNVLFLNWVIENLKLPIDPKQVNAFPAKIENDYIKLSPYHSHECPNCDSSLCK